VVFTSKFLATKYCDSDNESNHISDRGGILLLVQCICYMYTLLFKLTFTHNGLNLHSWKGKAVSVSEQHVLKVYRGMDIKLNTFLTSTLDGVVSFTLPSLRVIWNPLNTRMGSSQSWSGCDGEEECPSPHGNQIPHFQDINTLFDYLPVMDTFVSLCYKRYHITPNNCGCPNSVIR
jgi:hypothetical protein